MKLNVSKDKTLSMEEGLTLYQKNYEEFCFNRAAKNSKWIRCIQFTKVTFYLVMILFVGWFAITMFLSEYPYPEYVANKNETHEFMTRDQNGDNTAVNSNIIPAEDVIRSKIEEGMITTTTEKNKILISKCFFDEVKLDSSNDKSDLNEDSPVLKLTFGKIEQSPNEKSVNVENDKEKFDSSNDEMISNEDSEMPTIHPDLDPNNVNVDKQIVSFFEHMVDDLISATNFDHEVLDDTDKTRDYVDEDSPVLKLTFGKIEQSPNGKSVNVENDKEKFDSSNDEMISNEDSEMSTIHADLDPNNDIVDKQFVSFLEHMVDDLISTTNFDHEVLDDTDKTRDDVNESLIDKVTIQDFYDQIYDDDVNLSSPDMPEALMEPEHSTRKNDEDIQDDYAKTSWSELFFPDPTIWDNDYTTSEEIDY